MVGIASLAPNATRLAEEIEREARNNPAKRGQFDSLKQTLDHHTSGYRGMTNMSGIAKFEGLLASDPAFKQDVRRLALQNPAALERIVPDLLENPNGMKQLITTTAAANAPRPVQAAAAQPAAAPAAARPQSAAPAQAAAAPARPAAKPAAEPAAAPATAAAVPAAPETASGSGATSAKPGEALQIMADKMAQLKQIPGYDDLQQRIESNPQLAQMFKTLLDPSKDMSGAGNMLDDILNRAGKTPEERAQSTLLTDLVKTMDEKPGMVSSIASNFANDPKTGMMMIGMYSQFNQGIGKTLDGFLSPGALDGMLMGLMGLIGKILGQSGGLMNMSNNGGGLLQQVMGGLGVNPNTQISSVDPENGAVTTTTAEQYGTGGTTAAVAANRPAANPNPNERNAAQNPAGPQPTPG